MVKTSYPATNSIFWPKYSICEIFNYRLVYEDSASSTFLISPNKTHRRDMIQVAQRSVGIWCLVNISARSHDLNIIILVVSKQVRPRSSHSVVSIQMEHNLLFLSRLSSLKSMTKIPSDPRMKPT